MRRVDRWGAMTVLTLVVMLGASRDDKGEGRLTFVEAEPRDDLDGVVTAAISPDGKFLYASSWKAGAVVVFTRDAQTGKLEPKQTISDPDVLGGATTIALSPDGRWAIANAFQTKSVILLGRDAETGELTQADVARDGEKEVRVEFPIDVAFSRDSRFVYVLDDEGPGEEPEGSVLTFRVNDGKLEHVATDVGVEKCYAGARGIAVHPDGKTLFIVCRQAGTLVVADCDKETGKTSVRQIIQDEKGDVHGLGGAMGVVASPDGKHVYVSAGRFSGDNAISVFRLKDDGRLDFVEEFQNGEGEFLGFEGGNHLTVSPDGRNVYAAATRSGSVACFRRDTATGKLSFLETVPDGGPAAELGATGVTASPDGKFVYVPTEDKKGISVFKRDAEK